MNTLRSVGFQLYPYTTVAERYSLSYTHAHSHSPDVVSYGCHWAVVVAAAASWFLSLKVCFYKEKVSRIEHNHNSPSWLLLPSLEDILTQRPKAARVPRHGCDLVGIIYSTFFQLEEFVPVYWICMDYVAGTPVKHKKMKSFHS